MRQKLALVRALLHDLLVVFLDEPTSGLDPAAARLVRGFIKQVRAEGRTIFLTTHNLAEADELADMVGSSSSACCLVPVIVPGSAAAYSVIGEKIGRTLEPLLATPVQTWELLTAKVLAAVLPGVFATWLAGAMIGTGVLVLAISPAVTAAILSPERLLLLGLVAPVLALAVVSLTVAISARVTDVRTAQQTFGVLVLPVLLLLFSPTVGSSLQGVAATLAMTALLTVIAGGLFLSAVHTFQREAILTQWH